MTNNLCSKCGAELVAGARFCRRCGQPSATFNGASVTEAETRIFTETAERAGPETQYYDQRPTGFSYLAPNQTATPQGTQTKALEEARRKRKGVIWGSLFVLLVIAAFTIVAAMKLAQKSAPTTTPAATTKPEIPVPPVPPVPPPPPTADTTTAATALDYPGAEVTMEMTRGNDGSIRQLHTSDSFDKVVAWYKEKLKPSDPIMTREKDGSSAVLNGAAATAIITADSEEEGTQILLKKGIDR
ncbi:MAG: zinc-ribbon domain-containing protein [Acidobacteria bacterium]|nr:zinc-ribbon domain-containing protein [Acidobacteriota bacterium]